MSHEHSHDSSCCKTKKPWYKERVTIVVAIISLVLISSYYLSFLEPVRLTFFDYARLIWWAILLGLVLGGIIEYFIPDEYISKYLSKNKKSTIFYATGLGFLMSACSHGILALAIQLYKKGASVPAVIAFLLAAPWANFAITIMLFALFGFKALYLVISAIVIAIITGLAYQVLDRKNLIEKGKQIKVSSSFSIKADVKKRFKSTKFNSSFFKKSFVGVSKGSWDLSRMVLWWILIGMSIAAVARAYVPTELFHKYMGATFLGMIITLVVATIIEVCSEGSSPIAFEIFNQTGAFGNSFIFLMAGVATDYTEIGLIWANIGRRAAIWLPIITVPQILLLGWAFNFLI